MLKKNEQSFKLDLCAWVSGILYKKNKQINWIIWEEFQIQKKCTHISVLAFVEWVAKQIAVQKAVEYGKISMIQLLNQPLERIRIQIYRKTLYI